jgi:dynamin GTPase
LDAVAALLSGNGPAITQEIPWVAIAAAHGSEDSLETAWKAEAESLKSLLTQAAPTKLGRVALVETIAKQIRKRLKQRIPTLLSG